MEIDKVDYVKFAKNFSRARHETARSLSDKSDVQTFYIASNVRRLPNQAATGAKAIFGAKNALTFAIKVSFALISIVK